MRMLPILLVLVFGAAASARADSPRPEPMKPPESVAVQAFGAHNPACQEWTDGCVICARSDKGANCSTPGLACQPGAVLCQKPKSGRQ